MGGFQLSSFCFIYICICIVNGQEAFLQAFPSASKQDFLNLPDEARFSNVVPVEPAPLAYACPTIPAPPPTDDVNKLQPGHIKVVMSMGDSITAAMSAKDTTVINLREYRGISYAIGGDTGVVTLPNLIKQYSPTGGYPIGMSTGIGQRTIAGNGLNAAVSGSINSDMLGQAQWLVAQLKANSKINLKEDWKVLTIWIGSNNICQVCNDAANNNALNYEKNIFLALEHLYANVPRLFVNLLSNLDITQLYDFNSGACGILHPYECPCPSSRSALVRQGVKSVIKEYVATGISIAANYTARNHKEFAVVVQPFLSESVVFNRSYISAADCFHPSAIAHQLAGISLWNSMITPVGKKNTAWNPAEQPLCATKDTLLYTPKNSQLE